MPIALMLLPILGVAVAFVWFRSASDRRRDYIDSFRFPPQLTDALTQRYPHLSDAQKQRALAGLRQYFHMSRLAKHSPLAMPSQAVDVLWHEFILSTRQYQAFCQKAFGRFLHHTPAAAMPRAISRRSPIKRAWRLACQLEGINPKAPSHLPLIFALDAELNIDDGFHYQLHCGPQDRHCASHIGCSSYSCSSDSGNSWFDGDAGGDGGGCSGGD
ncbi:glycine-rich domain-containing protein [Shewanella khirikhana]|uniref:DUF4381 domain-containing protein n=1 Tax=Shewanella khirikhana TaxID=1965282 RepID=A0ABM7DRU0_9GAMM|nr:hypothetical protein [Shewanella khirikhana]AZQ12418.1 hypothetical protein STH12_03358 [Shewanella khirikhana]